MKRLIFLSFILCLCNISMQAQLAKECFTALPDSLCPLLTAVNRADCIDFLESNMKAEITNRFGSRSEMTELTPDYIRMQLTPQTTWEMKLLPANDSTKLICTVATACALACDSDIHFYTTDWQELPASSLLPSLPVMDDFIAAAPDTTDIYTYEEAHLQADMLLMKAALSGKENTLTFSFTTPDYMEKEAAEKLKPFLRRPVTYIWEKGRFRPVTLP